MARTINQEARIRTHGDPVVTFVRARIPLSRSLPPTFEDALKAPREPKDDVYIKNEEDEQGDDVTVRRNERVDRLLKRCDWNGWDNLVHALGKSRGCRHISCGRIAEDPELVLFVIGRFPPPLSPLFFFLFPWFFSFISSNAVLSDTDHAFSLVGRNLRVRILLLAAIQHTSYRVVLA